MRTLTLNDKKFSFDKNIVGIGNMIINRDLYLTVLTIDYIYYYLPAKRKFQRFYELPQEFEKPEYLISCFETDVTYIFPVMNLDIKYSKYNIEYRDFRKQEFEYHLFDYLGKVYYIESIVFKKKEALLSKAFFEDQNPEFYEIDQIDLDL